LSFSLINLDRYEIIKIPMDKNIKQSILKEYENKWVVIDKGYKKVLAAQDELDDLQRDIKELKIKDSIIMFVPPFNTALAPKCQ
jgi:hypothetical protein